VGKWVFSNFNGTVGLPHAFNTFLRRFHEENGLKPISPHLLRHMMGSYLLNSGTDLAAVSEKLGHANKAFTASVYIHAPQSSEKQSAETLENLTEPKTGQAK
jgi:site-specific recombinase XerD